MRLDGTITNVADRDYFKVVISTQQSYISDPSLTRGTGKLGVIIAVPVLEDGKLIKIVTGNVSLQRVTDLIKEVKFKDGGYATVIDDSGLVIAHSKRPELNGKMNIATKKSSELKMQNVEVDDNYIERLVKIEVNRSQKRNIYSVICSHRRRLTSGGSIHI